MPKIIISCSSYSNKYDLYDLCSFGKNENHFLVIDTSENKKYICRVPDANIKAPDAATNLKQKLRSLSPTKRKSETDNKEKGSNKKSTRISQVLFQDNFFAAFLVSVVILFSLEC